MWCDGEPYFISLTANSDPAIVPIATGVGSFPHIERFCEKRPTSDHGSFVVDHRDVLTNQEPGSNIMLLNVQIWNNMTIKISWLFFFFTWAKH